MSRYKPYGAYKDSGKVWLGRIPEHWRLVALKRVASICNGKDYKDVENAEGLYPVIGSGGEFASADSFLFEGESVLLGRKGTIDKPLYINGPFWTVDTMFYTKIANDAFPKFVYYAALNIPFGSYQTNTALPSMAGEDLSSHVICVPQYDEQREIAEKLDRELASIDTLIEKKTLFIDLLKQKRQAIIIQAITKGLDPNVKMRDSGIEWIGSVPQHWGVPQLRRVIRSVEQGWSPDCHPGQAGDEEWGILKAGCVNNGEYRESENKALPPSLDARPEYEVHCGDILMSRASGTPAFVGSVALVGATRPKLMLSDKIFRIRLESNVCPRFFVTALGSRILRLQIENELSGGNGLANNLPQSALMEFVMPLPPVGEQEAISEHLALMTANLDLLVDRTKLSITLLRERRTALITAAVTGQIDLREDIA